LSLSDYWRTYTQHLYPVEGETASNYLDNYLGFKNFIHSDAGLKIKSEVGSGNSNCQKVHGYLNEKLGSHHMILKEMERRNQYQ
jgi:hypothetical protein